jgi:hypothetical protein
MSIRPTKVHLKTSLLQHLLISLGPTRNPKDITMQTPNSTSTDRPAKRLRLGTKSCAECRRRKVRCIFEPNTKICKECSAHESECISQQQFVQATKKAPNGEGPDVQVKLQNLEEMVHRLCEAMNMRAESSNCSPFEMSAAEALTSLSSSYLPENNLGTTPNVGAGWREVSESRSSASSDHFESFDDAPLLNFFQEAMLIQRQRNQSQQNDQRLSSNSRTKTYIKAIKALIPSPDELELILQMTETFWPIWEDSLQLIIGPDPHSITGIASAKKFIQESMESGTPVMVAKTCLFLALCVQQLPSTFKMTSLPTAPNVLVDSYIRGADALISINEGRSASVNSLECLTILFKLYLNKGRPREAWQCVRRAFNSALLLGLHIPNDAAPHRQKIIWAYIWQVDRSLSALLGLPAATTDSHPGVQIRPSGQQYGEQFMYDIAVIAGHINERNQNNQTATYAVTLTIDQEIEQCKNRIPADWWNSISYPSTPRTAIYGLCMLKVEYYTCQKMLHLPYMLKSSLDNGYEYSRLRALDACREIIKAYQVVREHADLRLTICDVMDFQAFMAAVVLVIDLLNQSSQLETHQEASDWGLVHKVTGSMKDVSKTMECTVAGQAFDLLEHLSTFRAGAYAGPDNYEVTIPMFGRVKINRPKTRILQQTAINDFYNGNQFQQQFMPMVEFSANSFEPFGVTGDMLSEAELGIDWTSVLNTDYNYDWSQTFDGSLFGSTTFGS